MNVPLHWHTEPLLLLLIVGVSWAYALACGPLRARCAPGLQAYPRNYAICFHLGVLVAYIAVGSPLDQIGEAFLFSAHMLQHMLLIYVAAPLIILGLVWHFPELYEAALRDRTLHVIEHWLMFLPALLMVWPLVSRSRVLPRISFGGAMVYCFALMIADLPLWAVLIFGEQPIYETYRLAPRITALTASSDMILGAAIMKGFNEVFALVNMALAFFLWYKRDR